MKLAEQNKLTEDVGDWIDQYNIAQLIVEAVEEEWGIVTEDMCHELWLRYLYVLPSQLADFACHLPDPTED